MKTYQETLESIGIQIIEILQRETDDCIYKGIEDMLVLMSVKDQEVLKMLYLLKTVDYSINLYKELCKGQLSEEGLSIMAQCAKVDNSIVN